MSNSRKTTKRKAEADKADQPVASVVASEDVVSSHKKQRVHLQIPRKGSSSSTPKADVAVASSTVVAIPAALSATATTTAPPVASVTAVSRNKPVTRSSTRTAAGNHTADSLIPDDDKDTDFTGEYSGDTMSSAFKKEIPKSPILIDAESILQLGLSESQRKAFTLMMDAYKLQEATKLNNLPSQAIHVQQRAIYTVEEKLADASTNISSKFNLDDLDHLAFRRSGKTMRVSAIEGRNSGKQDRHVTPISYLTHAFADSIHENSTIDQVRRQILYLTDKLSSILIYEDPKKTKEVQDTIGALFDAYRPGEKFRSVGGHRDDPENIIKIVFSAYNDLPLLSMQDDKKTKSKGEGAHVTSSLKLLAEVEEKLGKYNEINIYDIHNFDTSKSVKLRQAGVSAPVRVNIEKLARKNQLKITPQELAEITQTIFVDFDYKKVKGELLKPTKDYVAVNDNDILFQLARRHLAIVFMLCPLLQEIHQDSIQKDFIDLVAESHGLSIQVKQVLNAYVTKGLAKIGEFIPAKKKVEDEIEMVKSAYDEAVSEYEDDVDDENEAGFEAYTTQCAVLFHSLEGYIRANNVDKMTEIVQQINELNLEFESRNESGDALDDVTSTKVPPVKSPIGAQARALSVSMSDQSIPLPAASSSTVAIAFATTIQPATVMIKSPTDPKLPALSIAPITHADVAQAIMPLAGSSVIVRASTKTLKEELLDRLGTILHESKAAARNSVDEKKTKQLDFLINTAVSYLDKINKNKIPTGKMKSEIDAMKLFITNSSRELSSIKSSIAIAQAVDFTKPPPRFSHK